MAGLPTGPLGGLEFVVEAGSSDPPLSGLACSDYVFIGFGFVSVSAVEEDELLPPDCSFGVSSLELSTGFLSSSSSLISST